MEKRVTEERRRRWGGDSDWVEAGGGERQQWRHVKSEAIEMAK